jgi:hypothetical protein
VKVRTTVAGAAAAAIAGTGVFALSAAASASTPAHTLTFTAETKSSAAFSDSAEAEQDTDVNAAGKVVGYDLLYVTLVAPTRADINITVDVEGGMLYGTARLTSTGTVVDGKVTGGTGAFAHAAGTLTVHAVNKAGTRHTVKITYHT